MIKNSLITVFLLFMMSCDYLEFKKDDNQNKGKVVASVGESKLYSSELKEAFPKNLKDKDSVVFAKSYINSWAKQQILMQKAEEYISTTENKKIMNLVDKYRQSLYINGYKERLIKQQLDTVVSEDEIISYYEKYKNNFRLSEDIVQTKYIIFGKGFVDKKQTIKKFKSKKEEDLNELEENIINYKDCRLNDDSWLSFDKFLTKIPPLRNENKKSLLRITNFIQKEDELGVYLVAINGVLKKNDTAPMSYIIPKIKELIIYKRKFELIKDIEKTLIDDAIKNNTFKEYN